MSVSSSPYVAFLSLISWSLNFWLNYLFERLFSWVPFREDISLLWELKWSWYRSRLFSLMSGVINVISLFIFAFNLLLLNLFIELSLDWFRDISWLSPCKWNDPVSPPFSLLNFAYSIILLFYFSLIFYYNRLSSSRRNSKLAVSSAN